MLLRIGLPETGVPPPCGEPCLEALRLLQSSLRIHIHDATPADLAELEGFVELRSGGHIGPYFDFDIDSLRRMQDGIPHWAEMIEDSVRRQYSPGPGRPWDTRDIRDRPSVMGIINLTPDSFSDGGAPLDQAAALAKAESMLEAGVEIIDLGGESTRPFSHAVDEDEETSRVMPTLRELRSISEGLISIDTMKPGVARKALAAGADIINDVSGLRDPDMRALAAEMDVPVVISHMRGNPRDMQTGVHFDDVVREVVDELRAMTKLALEAGVREEMIIIDPGIGFGKTARDNLEIIKRLREFRCLGYPVLVGASRKSFIGRVLDVKEDQRLEGSLAVAAECMRNGADILRVHDVEETLRTLRMSDALRSLTI